MADQFHRKVAKLYVLRDKADAPDEFVGRMVNCCLQLERQMEKLSEKEITDMIISMSGDEKRRGEVAQGLVYFMLTADKETFSKYIFYLSQMGDSWFQALFSLNIVCIEMFHKMQEGPKDNLLMFFREAIRCTVPKLDSVILNFLRTLNGTGDWNSRLRLSGEFAKLFMDNQDWFFSLKNGSMLFGVTVNTLSHFVGDIASSHQFDALKNILINVIVTCVRRRSTDVFLLGREFHMAIMRISKIPAITQLFADLLRKPGMFGIKNFEEVMFRSTHPTFTNNRISHELCKKIMFLIESVKPGQNNKHYEWFFNSHLKNAPDSQSLRGEIIRFILNCMPQQISGMTFEAKMHFIYYLINTAAPGPEAQWCKTAMWLDWWFYDPPVPYFALETGIAVVRYCLSAQATKANALLEYLVDAIPLIHPPSAARIHSCTNQAMRVMADFSQQNNHPPLSTVLESVRVDKSVKETVRSVFKDFVRNPGGVTTVPPRPTVIISAPPQQQPTVSNNNVTKKKSREEPMEINDREKSPSPPSRVRKGASKEEMEKDVESNYQMLRDDIKPIISDVKEKFKSEESDDSEKSDSVCRLLQNILDYEDGIDDDQLELIGQCLHGLIGRPTDNGKSLVPDPATEEAFNDVFSHPLYIIFRNLSYTPVSDTTSRTPLVTIIAAMRDRDNYISLLLLYFIKCGMSGNSSVMPNNDNVLCYQEVARACDKDVVEMLAEDLETMALEDDRLFSLILPFVFEKFPQEVGSSDESLKFQLLQVVCSHIDSKQLADLIGTLIREANSLFRKDQICNIVTASLEWPTTAQYTLWHLIHSEAVPMDWLLPIVPKVKTDKHAEASANLLLTLRRLDREAGMSLLRTILSRQPSPDDFFTINALRILIDDSDSCQKVAELLSSLIKKLINNNELHMNNTPAATKQQGKKATPKLCLEQVLSHLELFTRFCLTKEKKIAEQLFSKWLVQDAFKSIKSYEKAAFLRPKFSQLFAVVEILADDSPQSSRTLRGNRGNSGSSTPAKTSKRKDDDDDVIPVSSKAKKHRVVMVESDSD